MCQLSRRGRSLPELCESCSSPHHLDPRQTCASETENEWRKVMPLDIIWGPSVSKSSVGCAATRVPQKRYRIQYSAPNLLPSKGWSSNFAQAPVLCLCNKYCMQKGLHCFETNITVGFHSHISSQRECSYKKSGVMMEVCVSRSSQGAVCSTVLLCKLQQYSF